MSHTPPYTIQDFGPSDLLSNEIENRRRVKVSIDGELSTGGFGELLVANLKPIIQVTAQYGLRGEVETIAIGGSATAQDSKFVVSTGTGPGNIASIASTKLAAYRAGQGLLTRFTALFTEGVPNSSQLAGLLTSESALGFGYNGDEFGIVHARGGELEQWDLKVTTGASGAESATVTIDGNPWVIPITTGIPEKNAWEIGRYINSNVPGYAASSVGDTVNVLAQLPDLGGGAFTFSSATATATFTQIKSGLIPPETWIPKADWNVRPDLEFDPKLGNVYQVQMQYLGFGGLKFFVEDPATAEFVLVHVIRYANSATVPSVSNPIFRVGWGARNVGNTSDIVVQGASAAIFIEGEIVVDTDTIGKSVSQPNIGTTSTSILSLQNRRTYFGTANRAEIILRSLVLSTDTTKIAKFELVRNPVLAAGEFLLFNALGDNNLAEYSESQATVIGGDVIAAYDVKSLVPFQVEIGDITAKLQPGDIACIVARVSGGTSSEMSAALNWQDDL